MAQTKADRLKSARRRAGFHSASEAARALGVTVPTYVHHENGTRSFGFETAEFYATRFKVPASWLLFGGEGGVTYNVQRRVSGAEEYKEEQMEIGVLVQARDDNAFLREHFEPTIAGAIPELDVQVDAGPGRAGDVVALPVGSETYVGHKVVSEWLLPEDFIRNHLGATPSATVFMQVIGDCMEPTYRPGDRVLVDLSQNVQIADGVYVISDGESSPQIKRLQRVLFSKPPKVEVISDNPVVSNQTVNAADISIVGRVVGAISRK